MQAGSTAREWRRMIGPVAASKVIDPIDVLAGCVAYGAMAAF
jgi:hypothetical protein